MGKQEPGFSGNIQSNSLLRHQFSFITESSIFRKMTQSWKACAWWPERAVTHEGQEMNDNQSVNTHKML